MRRLRELNRYRCRKSEAATAKFLGFDGFGHSDLGGIFLIPSPVDGMTLRVHAAGGGGWDHVSISRPLRTPSWAEMEHVKRLVFCDDEVAFQLHVPASDHINVHPFCLHLWRPTDVPIPMPPAWMV